MKKSVRIKMRLFSLILMLMLISANAVSAFAVTGAFDSDNTDYNKNGTSNSTASRQENSTNTGTIRLGKILTVNQQNKFPNIEDFVYMITPIAAWDNANVSTNKSGSNIAPADMPKPLTSTASSHPHDNDPISSAHHSIKNIEPKNTGNIDTDEGTNPYNSSAWATLVSIGNFKDAVDANTSSVTNSNAASNTDKISEGKRRTRTTDVSFTFKKAGYYMYKIEEVGSKKNGSVEGLAGLRKDVAGVDYDDNWYYVVFYVCNRQATEDVFPGTPSGSESYGQGTQKGDTLGQEGYLNKVDNSNSASRGSQSHERSDESDFSPDSGVYVHTITSWTNQRQNAAAGKQITNFHPDNTMRNRLNNADSLAYRDAQNSLHDLMNVEDVDSGEFSTDTNNHSTQPNTGGVDNNNKGSENGTVEQSNGMNGQASASSNASTSGANKGPSTVTHDNLGKVGISTSADPDYLEAYRMWNGQVTHDVVLKKNVTGNLGDRTKRFEFEVTLTGLECNQTYTTNVAAGSTDVSADEATGSVNAEGDASEATNDRTGDQAYHQENGTHTTSGIELYEMTGATVDNNGDGGCPSFTTNDGDTTATVRFRVKLRDDEILVMNSLPRSSSYQVKEFASDHVPQYNIVSSNKASSGNMAVFTETGHTPGGDLGVVNRGSNTELSTKEEFVDRYDGTVTVIFQNNRDLATVTGVPGLDYMVYAACLAALISVALIVVRKRRIYAEEDILWKY